MVPWKTKGKVLWQVSLATTWVLWKERNARIFKGFTKGPQFIFNKVIALTISWVKILSCFHFVSAYELWHGWKEICNGSSSDPKVVQVWKPPAQGILRLNFDGSSMGNPRPLGIGGLLRDEDGVVLWAFRGPIGVAEASEAEFHAAHQDIKMLQNVDLNKVVVEGDSLNVIR
ncbi:uncharacterized protein LOC143861493 [Tasmannia lanceolata]|uniref:uncharacterized protein LOC143861493 n=1 Tax=Tasmannia lanceolata TaxID=3420 RepID=UPI0040633E84